MDTFFRPIGVQIEFHCKWATTYKINNVYVRQNISPEV